MANIFELMTEYNDLYAKMINYDTGEIDEVIEKALDIKREEVLTKSEKVGFVIRKLEHSEKEIDEEIKRLQALKKSCANTKDRLKDGLGKVLQRLEVDKVDGVNAKIFFRKSTETIIDDIEILPDEFKKAKITYTPDKTAIKTAIQNGVSVNGARLEEKLNLQVK